MGECLVFLCVCNHFYKEIVTFCLFVIKEKKNTHFSTYSPDSDCQLYNIVNYLWCPNFPQFLVFGVSKQAISERCSSAIRFTVSLESRDDITPGHSGRLLDPHLDQSHN